MFLVFLIIMFIVVLLMTDFWTALIATAIVTVLYLAFFVGLISIFLTLAK